MARIMFPGTFNGQTKLRDDMDARHTADGPASPLEAYFSQHGIHFADTATAATAAKSFDTARGLYARQAENYRELRDHTFDPPFARLKGMAQYLKSFYKGNVRELGNWGIPIDNKAKLVYPADFAGRYALYNTFYDKYTSVTGTNPLTPYLSQNNIDLAADHTAVQAAFNKQERMTMAAEAAEDQREKRDLAWAPVVGILRGAADFLKKLHGDNARAAGAWGITIDDSPRAPRMRNTALKAGGSITIEGATIGGHFINNGPGSLHLYRGKTTTGTPTMIPAGEDFGILKGWSTFTVINPDTLQDGKFAVLSTNNS